MNKGNFHIIWGFSLLIAGISVFLRMPHVIPKIEQIDQFSRCTSCLKFCFYFIGLFLICAGIKKIAENIRLIFKKK